MHAHFEAVELGIANVAAQKDFRQSVADELAGTELALRRGFR
jgi:hypothetical protein